MGRIKIAGRKLAVRRAQALRRGDTHAEARLWNALRAARLGGWTWKRQVPFGPYILDFFCREAALVVEADGGQHADQIAYDGRRTAYLERAGLRVLRFWNTAVLTNRDGVCETILDACGGDKEPSSPPAKLRGRGGVRRSQYEDVRRHALSHGSHGSQFACRSGQLKDGAKRRRGAARRRRVLDLA